MIDEMIEKLFLDLPYSETVDEAKARIREALQEEYEKERESYNELQAAGRVMGQYGTLEEAGCLAGYSKQEVEAWADVSLGMDVKEFRKVFRKERRFLYLKALAIAAVVNYLLNFLIFKELGLFIFIAVSAAIGLLCHRTLARMGQARAARNICLLSETYEALKEQSDQYGKRLMNCLTAAIGICALGLLYLRKQRYGVQRPKFTQPD